MKKIISSVLAAAMSVSMASSVFAYKISGYEFIDTAYSPELDMYVAMAKNFSSANNETQFYSSKDGIEWASCLSSPPGGRNYADMYDRQELVWWDKEGVFIAVVGGGVYYTKDGKKWTKSTNLTASNGIVETDGERLVLCGGGTVKFAKSLEEKTEDVVADAGMYIMGVGIYPDEEKYVVYNGMDGSNSTAILIEGEERNIDKKWPAYKQQPLDNVYSPELNGWIVELNKRADFLVVTSNSSFTSYTPITEDGANTEYITGIGVGEEYTVLGTVSGKLLYTENSKAAKSTTVWKTVDTDGAENAPEEEIRSITKSRDGFMLAVSKTGTYILQETEEGVVFADTETAVVEIDEMRIEAPQNGSEDMKFSLKTGNYFSQPSDPADVVTECEAMDDTDGMSASWNGKQMIVTVPESADGIKDFKVTDKQGKEHIVSISFVKENDVMLDGYDTIAIPEEGSNSVLYKTAVIASDGKKMLRNAHIEVVSAPEGVIFDESSSTVNLTNDSSAGTLVLRVISDGKPENYRDFEISITKRMPTSIEVGTSRDSVLISDTEDILVVVSATIKDQVNNVMEKEKVKWSLMGNTEGITIDENTGDTVISPKAHSGELKVVATSLTDETIKGEATIKLEWNAQRSIKEDMAIFEENIVTGKDLPFKNSENGTKMTFKSSNEAVIANDGKITRDRKKDTYATVYIEAENEGIKASKTVNVTVLKADNFAPIGDFEDGESVLENVVVTQDVANNGEKSAIVNKSMKFDVELNNDCAYVFEAYVKSSSSVKIGIDKGKDGATSSGRNNWEKIAVSSYYSGQNKEFTETVSFVSNGDFYIDDVKVYEMTLEYTEAAEAVSKAEYSKKQSDITEAKNALKALGDTPLANVLEKRINSIGQQQSQGGNGGGTGGGGSGSPSSNKKNPTVTQTFVGESAIGGKTVNNDAKIEYHKLSFKDMLNHWAKDDVEFMAEKGFVNGVNDVNFDPDANITRAQFAKLIIKTMGLGEAEYENTYFDVVSEDWYSGYVQTAKNEGYMAGYDGLFRPNDHITREEIAKVIVSAYNKKTGKQLEMGNSIYFNDMEEISAWAYDYIAEATREGFINGINETMFAPKMYATRAQAVVMLKRLFDKIEG